MKFLQLNDGITFVALFFQMIKFVIQRSEIGAGTRGSSLGPDAIKIAAVTAGSSLFLKYESELLSNQNDCLFQPTATENALRIGIMEKVWQEHADKIHAISSEKDVPVVISGDHASAGATIAGLKMAHPNKRLGVVWIDAHADLHSPYTSPSGNIHGMPLCASIGENNVEMQSNEPLIVTKEAWSHLKNVGGISPKISPDDLVFVSVRDTEKEEEHLMEKYNIKNYSVAETRELGMKKVGIEIQNKLSDCDIIYVSFDVDSMDPDIVSYGTGTPVKDGITPAEAKDLINELLQSQKIVCFELVEVNPLLDNKGNKMAEVALEVLESAVNTLEKR
jgi:arginase